MWEVEQKFVVENLVAVREAFARLGITLGNATSQSDLYLRHPSRDFAATDEALRVRRNGDKNALTYKGPRIDATTKTRLELEVPLEHGEQHAANALEIFSRLGFGVVVDVRKQRAHGSLTWEGVDMEIVLDEVDRLGLFVEIETTVKDQSSIGAAQAAVASLARDLGLARNQRKSYCELLLELRTPER
jgi:adenylate cyclase, class 2